MFPVAVGEQEYPSKSILGNALLQRVSEVKGVTLSWV